MIWLINCTTLELVDFAKDVPPYAILSHTWKDEEVIFQDMNDLEKAAKKEGFTKIKAMKHCSQSRISIC